MGLFSFLKKGSAPSADEVFAKGPVAAPAPGQQYASGHDIPVPQPPKAREPLTPVESPLEEPQSAPSVADEQPPAPPEPDEPEVAPPAEPEQPMEPLDDSDWTRAPDEAALDEPAQNEPVPDQDEPAIPRHVPDFTEEEVAAAQALAADEAQRAAASQVEAGLPASFTEDEITEASTPPPAAEPARAEPLAEEPAPEPPVEAPEPLPIAEPAVEEPPAEEPAPVVSAKHPREMSADELLSAADDHDLPAFDAPEAQHLPSFDEESWYVPALQYKKAIDFLGQYHHAIDQGQGAIGKTLEIINAQQPQFKRFAETLASVEQDFLRMDDLMEARQ